MKKHPFVASTATGEAKRICDDCGRKRTDPIHAVVGDDPFKSPQFLAWAERVKTELVPKLRSTGLTVSMVPENPTTTDVKFAVELGMSIMLDKPIVLMVQPGTELPDHLVRVADRIVEFDPANAGDASQRLHEAMEEILGVETDQ